MSRRFARTREDFRCFRCDATVSGDGYTNHCPICLWSLHVDVQPGDRSASCRAPMRPAQLLYERDEFVLLHECTSCGATRRCRTSADDDLTSFGL